MAKAIRNGEDGGGLRALFPDGRPASSGDGYWKQLCNLGNAAFAEGRWAEAERHYAAAMGEAERIFAAMRANSPIPGADAVPMLVVSVANAAENWLRAGQGARAGEILIALRRKLCGAIEDETLAAELREHCFVHLKHAVMALVDTLPRAGIADDVVKQEVEAARSVALRFMERNASRH